MCCLGCNQALRALYGLALCFFGGIFANTIAAVEAFKQSGYERAKTCFHELRHAAAQLYEANEKDNRRDDNHDGVADVNQINRQQLLSRKMVLIIRTVDPAVLQQAFIGLYQGFIGVLASLRFKFAKSIALGLSVGNMARRPLAVVLAPTLKHMMKPGKTCCQSFEPVASDVLSACRHQLCPDALQAHASVVLMAMWSVAAEDCKKWSPMIVNYASKSIAMMIAFALQSRISAIQSAAMGGQVFARSLLQLGRERGLVMIAADDTYMDEVVGWSVAAIGEKFPLDFTVP